MSTPAETAAPILTPAPANTPARTRPPKYNSGNFNVFLKRFSLYVAGQGVKEDLVNLLLSCIECDRTFTKLERLDFADQERRDVGLLLERLSVQEESPEEQRMVLSRIQQGTTESIDELVDRIRELAIGAFGDRAPEQINTRMIDALQDAITDRKVARKICKWRTENPEKTFDEIAADAKKKIRAYATFESPEADDAAVFAVRRNGSECCQLCGKVGHVATQCYGFEVKARQPTRGMSSRGRPAIRGRGMSTRGRTFTCHGCGEEGHVIRFCPHEREPLNGEAVGDRGHPGRE